MRLKDKVVAVTGGGRGIGRAIALAHAAEGAKVAVLSRTESDLEETVGLIAGMASAGLAVPVDLVDYGQVESAVGTIARELGPVDVLINNAGNYVAIGPVWEVDPDEWWRDVEVNVRPTYNCCRVVLPSMIAHGGGRIINLIGGGTAGAFAYGSGYAVGKSGVMRLTECLAQEVSDSNVSVLAMAPGLVRTAMTDYQRTSDAGKKYLQAVIKRLEDRDELPPERARRPRRRHFHRPLRPLDGSCSHGLGRFGQGRGRDRRFPCRRPTRPPRDRPHRRPQTHRVVSQRQDHY